MGIITAKRGNKKYTIELELHGQRRTELPIEKLNAVCLETGGAHPKSAQKIEKLLNEQEAVWESDSDYMDKDKSSGIIKRTKKNASEIWLTDVSPTILEQLISLGILTTSSVAGAFLGVKAMEKVSRRRALHLLGGITTLIATARYPHSILLSREGDASKRRVSGLVEKIHGKIDPVIYFRNLVMAHKIQALAEKTGHQNIGILVGAGHVGIADLLKKGEALTEEQRAKIAERGPDALKMYRCIYDKTAGKWKVEEHSL